MPVCNVCKQERSIRDYYFVTVKGQRYRRRKCKPCHQQTAQAWKRANGVVAMVGVLHYTSEGLTSMPCFVPMTDIARTGHSREDTLRAYYENGRWVFVPSVDEDTQPMETIR